VIHPLLQVADELERRDTVVAAELVRVEQLQAEVEEIRVHGDALAEWLAWAPGAVAQLERDASSALTEAAQLEAQLQGTEDELERARLRVAIADAEHRSTRARENADSLELEIRAREDERDRLRARATALTPEIRGMDVPQDLAEWTSRARGALLVERSGLARERDAIVREASALLGSVLGDPYAATSVAGLRDRLQRALA